MKEAKAFSPCHITGIFEIHDQTSDALHVGSRGAGVSLSQGVKTSVKLEKALKDSVEVSINSLPSNSAAVSKSVVTRILSESRKRKQSRGFSTNVKHQTDIPIGAGFGTSGAAALSLALALNEAFELGLSRIEAAQIAHKAEVECKTGLGTVIAENFGGLEIRTKPGAPGIGEIRQAPIPKDTMVACISFGPLSTKKMLTDQKTRERINQVGGLLTEKLLENANVSNFLKLSREFAEHVGLITDGIRRVLNSADNAGFVCSMPMFGESVFTLVDHNSLDDILEIFRESNPAGRVFYASVDFEGARGLD